MGDVYSAIHPVIAKRVAIKVLHAELSKDPDAVERFVLEARIVNEKSDWDVKELAAAIDKDLAPGFTDLTTDLEAFNTEPFV